jgi:glycosyltransferase involved in cell wall biosynthesis
MIRQRLPDAELHIYGSYASEADLALTDKSSGFLVKGRADSAEEVIQSARVLLAPLRFGAGLKGKLLEAMQFGTPSVTTSVGAEGMSLGGEWNGFVCDEPEAFARSAVRLYEDSSLWKSKQQAGYRILKNRFERSHFESSFSQRLQELMAGNGEVQMNNVWANAVRYHSFRGARFMSKWIEEKNK